MMKHRNAVYVLCVLLAALMLFAAGCAREQAEETESKAAAEQISDVQSVAEADCKILRIIDAESVPAVLQREPIRDIELPAGIDYSDYLVEIMKRAADDELIDVAILPNDFYTYPYLYQELCEDTYQYKTQAEINETAMRTIMGDEAVDRYVKIAKEKEGEFLWDEHAWDRLQRAGMPDATEEHPDVKSDYDELWYSMCDKQMEYARQQIREWMDQSIISTRVTLRTSIEDRGGMMDLNTICVRLTVGELLEVGQLKWMQPRSNDGSIRNDIELSNEVKIHFD